ncbi:conserved hypothetical protein [Talaromyces stipitatus ATCC 10500]|uniref:Transcription factor Iwr1 domain-containing protein n=1 Tax=Talaromyces stipitatus (strain ATCC 10500 / CBS 375.48 / QM 6759 / NRRL 1006) TaxID=441959 RepID=B8M2N8_TALSN|nr:uncharacterized protein TSTA_091900 [Talaromyces stipitatus ATCC 10500]EED21949.1 conserved hypothetical protein [Talaromyces stipitatus ATCC 10500]
MNFEDKSLPPEQFHVKRRREEEPVDTLYIQSELQQKKRRFTDFVFQRVKGPDDSVTGEAAGDGVSSPSSPAAAALQSRLRSSRSVSTSGFPDIRQGRPAGFPAGTSGIPTVRATSPGAEFRSERALAASQRQEAEAKRKRLQEPISKYLGVSDGLSDRENEKSASSSRAATPASSRHTPPLSASPAPFPTSLRRFHISRPSTPLGPLKGSAGSGVMKGNTPTRARAVLVEKLIRAPSLRGASVIETLEKTAGSNTEVDTVVQSQIAKTGTDEETAPTRRKRPIVNQAEKKWREEQKSSISAAKEHLTTKFEPQEDDLDKLAKELEDVMLDIEAEENQMDVHRKEAPSAPARVVIPRPNRPLKFKPRSPGTRRAAQPETSPANEQHDKMEQNADAGAESDGDYVYDTYVRVPIHTVTSSVSGAAPQSDITGYEDPLAEANTPGGITIDPTRTDVGVVVITSDDEELWDQYLEDDQDSEVDWDGDDVDSNAEDNPANDYPDDEVSSADEYDDNPRIYHRYRMARSDDEEYDVNEFDDEVDYDDDYRKHMYDYVGDDDDDD